MKVGDVVRNVNFPKYEGVVVDMMSYHGVIKIKDKNNVEYAFSPEQLEVLNEYR